MPLHGYLQQQLAAPLTSLAGLGEEQAGALRELGIQVVFDLATSPPFLAAWEIARAAEGQFSAASTLMGRVGAGLVEADHAFRPATELLSMPLSALRGIDDFEVGPLLSASLGTATIGELATYPPFVAARGLLEELMQASANGLDPGTPVDLLPGASDMPTEITYFNAAVINIPASDSGAGGDGNNAFAGPLNLLSDPVPVNAPQFGALLRYQQAWHRQGMVLGQLLHSLALAPGESTNVAVIDWSRRERGSRAEEEDQAESLSAQTSQDRAISETARSVAREVQTGFSWTVGSSTSLEAGVAGGQLVGAGVMGYSAGAAQNLTTAISASRSTGERSVAAETGQRITEATQQAANSARSRRATVVREVSQDERESISTRTVTNYNHMHALTVQYHEVLQLYRSTLKLVGVDRLIFLPLAPFDFTDARVIRRFRPVLRNAALDSVTAALLEGVGENVTVDFLLERPWEQEVIPTASDTKAAARARAKSKARARAEVAGGFAAARIAAAVIDVQGTNTWTMPGATQLVQSNWSGNRLTGVEVRTADDSRISLTAGTRMDTPLPLDQIRFLVVQLTQGPPEEQDLHLAFITTGGKEVVLPLSFAVPDGRDTATLLQVTQPPRSGELASRLQAHALHYSQAIWASISPQDYVAALGEATQDGERIVDMIDPVPLAISGTSIGFRWNGKKNQEFNDWRDVQLKTSLPSQYVSMPTGGVFGEAVLGRAMSAERLDLTRFWNWQDSPIPFRAPDIAAIEAGSRHRPTDLRPSGLADAVIQLQQLKELPDPTGLGAILQAVASAEMFRDMSGLAETIGLARSQAALAAEGAAHASTQAGSNMATAGQVGLESLKLALSLIGAANGIPIAPPGPGTSNITNAGAAFNAGRALDNDLASAARAAGSGSSIAGSTLSGGSTGSPSVSGAAASAGNTRRAFDSLIGHPPENVVDGRSSNNGAAALPGVSLLPPGADATLPTTFLPDITTEPLPEPGIIPHKPPAVSELEKRKRAELRGLVGAENGLDTAKAVENLSSWYDQGVRPLLQQAEGNDQFVVSAIAQWLNWQEDAATLGLDDRAEFAERLGQSAELVRLSLDAAIDSARRRMILRNDLRYMDDVRDWVGLANIVGVDLDLSEAILACPLSVEIGVPNVPTLSEGESGEIVLSARARIGSNAPLARAVAVEMSIDGGNANPAAGRTTLSGAFPSELTRTTDSDMVIQIKASFQPLAGHDTRVEAEKTVTIN